MNKAIGVMITLILVISLLSCGIGRSDFIFNISENKVSFSKNDLIINIEYSHEDATNQYNNDDFVGYEFYYKIYEPGEQNITNDKKNGISIDYYKNKNNKFFRLQGDGNTTKPCALVSEYKDRDFNILISWADAINHSNTNPLFEVKIGDQVQEKVSKRLKRMLPDINDDSVFKFKNFWRNGGFHIDDIDLPAGIVAKIRNQEVSPDAVTLIVAVYMLAYANISGLDKYSEPICITKDIHLEFTVNISTTE